MTKIPFGLNKKELEILKKCSVEYAPKSLDAVLKKSEEHIQNLKNAAKEKTSVNLRLANAIFERIQKIPKFRNQLSSEGLFWIKGGAAYFFTMGNAGTSGFAEHTEVWNACAQIAGLDELSIWTEDFS